MTAKKQLEDTFDTLSDERIYDNGTVGDTIRLRSPSGNLFEVNDSENHEHVTVQHRSGSMIQMQSDGSWSPISEGDPDSPLRNEADDEAIAKAEAEYDSTKAKIDSKEQQLDLEMKNLDTERSALDTEIDSVKKIIDTNIQRSFKMFQNA